MPALVLILAGGLLRGQFEKRVRQDELRAGARQSSLGANPYGPGPV